MSVAAILVLLGSVETGETGAVIVEADGRVLVVGALIVVTQLIVQTRRWMLLLASLSARRIGVAHLIGPVLLGYLGHFVLPSRLGEVVRSVAVSRREGLPLGARRAACQRDCPDQPRVVVACPGASAGPAELGEGPLIAHAARPELGPRILTIAIAVLSDGM